jgi:glutaredoxin
VAPLAYALVVCLAAGPPDALGRAKKHLAAGALDDVLVDVQEAPVTGAAFAELLAEAGRQALEKEDDVLALHFVQVALRASARHPLALEVGARASMKQNHFDPAEAYADRWVNAEPKNARAWLLRAEVALAEGEWSRVLDLLAQADPARLAFTDRQRMKTAIETAAKELRDREKARTRTAQLEKSLDAQLERIKKAGAAGPKARGKAEGGPVIVYGTSWCGYCKKAARWLSERGVAVVEKDIESDAAANDELEAKKRSSKRSEAGVPWIDFRGTLVYGFDQRALEELL